MNFTVACLRLVATALAPQMVSAWLPRRNTNSGCNCVSLFIDAVVSPYRASAYDLDSSFTAHLV